MTPTERLLLQHLSLLQMSQTNLVATLRRVLPTAADQIPFPHSLSITHDLTRLELTGQCSTAVAMRLIHEQTGAALPPIRDYLEHADRSPHWPSQLLSLFTSHFSFGYHRHSPWRLTLPTTDTSEPIDLGVISFTPPTDRGTKLLLTHPEHQVQLYVDSWNEPPRISIATPVAHLNQTVEHSHYQVITDAWVQAEAIPALTAWLEGLVAQQYPNGSETALKALIAPHFDALFETPNPRTRSESPYDTKTGVYWQSLPKGMYRTGDGVEILVVNSAREVMELTYHRADDSLYIRYQNGVGSAAHTLTRTPMALGGAYQQLSQALTAFEKARTTPTESEPT